MKTISAIERDKYFKLTAKIEMEECFEIIEEVDREEWSKIIEEIKVKVQRARVRTALAANKELILLYFEIGLKLLERQEKHKPGKKFVDNIIVDLKEAFPNVPGLSKSNVGYMRRFAPRKPPGDRLRGPATIRPSLYLQMSPQIAYEQRVLHCPFAICQHRPNLRCP